MRSRRVWKQQGAREATATAAPPSQEAGIIATASQPGCGGEGKEKQTRTDGQHAICALSLDWAGPPVWLLRAGTADRETEVADEQSAVGLRQARLLALPNRPKHSHGTLVRGRALVLDKLGMMRCVVCQGRFPFRCAAGLFPLQAQTTDPTPTCPLPCTHTQRARQAAHMQRIQLPWKAPVYPASIESFLCFLAPQFRVAQQPHPNPPPVT